jgi:hypothetical protein
MFELGLSLVPQLPKYSTEKLYEMFGATAQLTIPEVNKTAEQAALAYEIAATKPTPEFIEGMIKNSWKDEYSFKSKRACEINKKLLVMFQIYPELWQAPSMLQTVIDNCYDKPLRKENYFPPYTDVNVNLSSTTNEDKQYYGWVNGYYDNIVGKSNIFSNTELNECRGVKYALLTNGLAYNEWKLSEYDFMRILNTAFARSYYCVVVNKHIEDILFLPFILNKINEDDVVERSEFKKDASFLKNIFNGIYNKVLDYHAGLKVMEAIEFGKSQQNQDVQTPSVDIPKAEEQKIIEDIIEDSGAQSKIAIIVSNEDNKEKKKISPHKNSGKKNKKNKKAISTKVPVNLMEELPVYSKTESHLSQAEKDDTIDEVAKVGLAVKDKLAGRSNPDAYVLVKSVMPGVPVLRFGNPSTEYHNGVGQTKIEWIVSNDDPWAQRYKEAQKKHSTWKEKPVVENKDLKALTLAEWKEKPVEENKDLNALTLAEQAKENYSPSQHPQSLREVLWFLGEGVTPSRYELFNQQTKIVRNIFSPK